MFRTMYNCSNCLANWETYVYDNETQKLIEIDYWDFYIKQKENYAGEDIHHKCESRISKCTCGCGYNQACDRNPIYCKFQSCTPQTSLFLECSTCRYRFDTHLCGTKDDQSKNVLFENDVLENLIIDSLHNNCKEMQY